MEKVHYPTNQASVFDTMSDLSGAMDATYSSDQTLCGITSVAFSVSGRLSLAVYDESLQMEWTIKRVAVTILMGHDRCRSPLTLKNLMKS